MTENIKEFAVREGEKIWNHISCLYPYGLLYVYSEYSTADKWEDYYEKALGKFYIAEIDEFRKYSNSNNISVDTMLFFIKAYLRTFLKNESKKQELTIFIRDTINKIRRLTNNISTITDTKGVYICTETLNELIEKNEGNIELKEAILDLLSSLELHWLSEVNKLN